MLTEYIFFRLQEEYLALQDEVKVTIEESKVVQEKYRSMYEACRRELAERHAQLEEIRTKVNFNSQCLLICTRYLPCCN